MEYFICVDMKIEHEMERLEMREKEDYWIRIFEKNK